jgi:hypothetical protein
MTHTDPGHAPFWQNEPDWLRGRHRHPRHPQATRGLPIWQNEARKSNDLSGGSKRPAKHQELVHAKWQNEPDCCARSRPGLDLVLRFRRSIQLAVIPGRQRPRANGYARA